ncbi:Uncharacterised protein [BD1-7 clade bacterium]|uniref:Phospholipid/glycerol acyltransferase domain-containing protein n=1 Tax=BD1-7 clade bacterium TaxID=2029982 RepID=A0A5S9QB98_9GAMM|nr:Uncharacterised protein [BD1-7 clade bacterium]CAA0119156.1 Uncharacterised protein [BD1-7 clade bacterium]
MTKDDFYYWRLFATGLSFFNFGLGGLILRFFIFPILSLAPGSPQTRHKRARKVIHWAMRLFIGQMRWLGVLTYDAERVKTTLQRPGQLIIANHPSLIDVVFLISFVPNANCIVRSGLFINPFTRGPLANAGYIPNRDATQLIDDCASTLAASDSLIIFPEGTRTPPGCKKPKLQRGAANIALAANIEPTPITIKCDPPTLRKGEKWYQIPYNRPHWTFDAGEPLGIPGEGSTPKAARELTKTFSHYFFPEVPQ